MARRKGACQGPAVSCAGVVEGPVRGSKNGALLNLKVSPRAKSTSLEGMHGDDALKLRVAAPPVDGRANAEIEKFLAGVFEVSASSVEVVRGASGRDKTVLFRGVEPVDIQRRISAMIH
jgi:uncharacterized protein (TIGR00251 family)